jgi:hypothetical protein
VIAALEEIIDAEGPIHFTRLAKLAASAFELGKVSETRQSAILRQLPSSMHPFDDEPFAWPTDCDPRTWTGYRRQASSDVRPIEFVNWREIVNAMVMLVVASRGMNEAELKREALAVFGGKRMTGNIAEVMASALANGIADGRLKKSAAGLVSRSGTGS